MGEIESKRVPLNNGWSNTPVGDMVLLGDLPLNIAIAPSGKLLEVANNGQSTLTVQHFDGEHFPDRWCSPRY